MPINTKGGRERETSRKSRGGRTCSLRARTMSSEANDANGMPLLEEKQRGMYAGSCRPKRGEGSVLIGNGRQCVRPSEGKRNLPSYLERVNSRREVPGGQGKREEQV